MIPVDTKLMKTIEQMNFYYLPDAFNAWQEGGYHSNQQYVDHITYLCSGREIKFVVFCQVNHYKSY